MRMNSVPVSQISSLQLKHSAALLYVITSARALPTTAHTVQLVLLHGKKRFLGETRSNNLPRNVLLLKPKLTTEHNGWCNRGPWLTATYQRAAKGWLWSVPSAETAGPAEPPFRASS